MEFLNSNIILLISQFSVWMFHWIYLPSSKLFPSTTTYHHHYHYDDYYYLMNLQDHQKAKPENLSKLRMKSFVILWRCFKHIIIEFIIEFMDLNHAFMNHAFQNVGLSNFRSNFNFYLSKIWFDLLSKCSC